MLVAFAGLSGSGKDAAADCLLGHTKVAIATPLKSACQLLFQLADDQVHGAQREIVDDRYGKTPRELMQMLGTDFVRDQVSESFWVDRLMARIEKAGPKVVVSDVRFQNEVDAIQKQGGRVFCIVRGHATACQHLSEQPHKLAGLDGVICNNGTLDQLRVAVLAAVSGA